MASGREFYTKLPGDVNIGVTSDRDLSITDRDELILGAYLPDVEVVDDEPASVDMFVHHIESENQGLIHGDNELILFGDWDEIMPQELPHLMYSIARSVWLKKGYYPTHAASVGNDASFALLPGHSGVGKSTVALEAIENHDQTLLSGNTTLIRFNDQGQMEAVAGTKTMTLKTDDFERTGFETNRVHHYGNRTAFELDAKRIAQGPQVIGRIALIRLRSDLDSWVELPSPSGLHTLYPLMLDTEYADCLVAGGAGAYLGDTPHKARDELVDHLRVALEGVSVEAGEGSKQFLAEKVSEL